jgi:hypothetical protein
LLPICRSRTQSSHGQLDTQKTSTQDQDFGAFAGGIRNFVGKKEEGGSASSMESNYAFAEFTGKRIQLLNDRLKIADPSKPAMKTSDTVH